MGDPLRVRTTVLPAHDATLNWLVQPPDSATATVVAASLGLTGALTYALRGPRPT